MKLRRAGTEQHSRADWLGAFALAALALGVVLSILFTPAFFATAISQADGPPDLGTAFNLPFKLEQGRPPPARASGPRQVSTPAAPTPAPTTPGGTPDPATPEPVAPGPPTDVAAFPVGFSVIEIEWTEPGGDVDGYEIQVSSDGGVTWQLLASKSDLTDPAGRLYNWYQQYELPGNQTRHYQVRAGNAGKWSDWSATVSATTLTTSSPRLSVAALDKNSVRISWDMLFVYATTAGWEIRETTVPPQDIFLVYATITGWEIQVTTEAPPKETITFSLPAGSPGGYHVRSPRTPDTRTWTTVATLAAGDRSYTHTGLAPGSTGYYRIKATTAVGTASWSREAHVITYRGPVPPAPQLSARANGATEIVLSWTGGAGPEFPVTSYEYQDSHDGNQWNNFDIVLGQDTRRPVYIAKPGTTRYYRIRAESNGVLGPWSNAASATTENGGAGEPADLKVKDFGDNWAELTWEAPQQVGAGITGYQVQRTTEDDIHTWVNVGSTNASELTFRDSGLEPDGFYQYRVAARDAGGLGPWVRNTVHTRTKSLGPPAPTLSVEAKYFDRGPEWPINLRRYVVWVELNWNDTENYHHHLASSPNGRDDWEERFATTTLGPGYLKMHDLDFGETRYYRVRAVSARDVPGKWSNVVKVTTRTVPPSHPPDLFYESKTQYQIKFSWREPQSNGGRPVSGYQIQAQTGGYAWNGNWSTLATPGTNTRTYTHSGLQPDTEYCYRIRAKNSVGWGNWTWGSDQCFRTKKQAPAAPAITVAENDNKTGVVVSWPEPDTRGLTISSYRVGISSNDEDWILLTDDSGRSVTYTYKDIRQILFFAGDVTEAYFRVRAMSTNGGIGDWSDSESIPLPRKEGEEKEEVENPAAPSITVAENSDATGAVVSWSVADSEGPTLSGFEVRISPNGVDWVAARTGVSTTQTSVTLTYDEISKTPYFAGTNRDKAYFRVRATATNGGVSDWSASQSISLPSE